MFISFGPEKLRVSDMCPLGWTRMSGKGLEPAFFCGLAVIYGLGPWPLRLV